MSEHENARTLAIVRQQFSYDPETGVLTRARTARRWKAGQRCGHLGKSGYVYVWADGRLFRAHRVAFAIYYGAWPSADIDHINCVKSDNRIENLRAATRQQNVANQRLRSTNRSGCKGVYWSKARGEWRAQITVNGHTKALGAYATFDEARAVYCRAAEVHFGEYARVA